MDLFGDRIPRESAGEEELALLHKIIGWLFGFVTIRIAGEGRERFVNACRYRGLDLWKIVWRQKEQTLYANIALRDYWKLRPVARKTGVVPYVVRRHGGPFVLQKMRKNASLFVGLLLFQVLVLFLSTRIWGVVYEGQQYHTKESLQTFFESIQVYPGVRAAEISCGTLENQLREQYQDIGWVSVEKKGSRLFVRMQEVSYPSGERKKQAARDVVAAVSGKVTAIVTRQGTPKVHVGDSVKKGDILIEGQVAIQDDSGEVVGTKWVAAEGQASIRLTEEYSDTIQAKYQRKSYTGKKKTMYAVRWQKKRFFIHNPLNRLETDIKYDILREGGFVCNELRFLLPVVWERMEYKEVKTTSARYTDTQAKEKLWSRYHRYVSDREAEGYVLLKTRQHMRKLSNRYLLEDKMVWQCTKTTYKKISKASMQKREKDRKDDGNNGDAH